MHHLQDCDQTFFPSHVNCIREFLSHLASKAPEEIDPFEYYWWDRDALLRRSRSSRLVHRRFASWLLVQCWASGREGLHNVPKRVGERILKWDLVWSENCWRQPMGFVHEWCHSYFFHIILEAYHMFLGKIQRLRHIIFLLFKWTFSQVNR